MGPLRNQDRRFLAEWLAVGVVLLMVAATLGVTLYRELRTVEVQEAERLETQARAIDENLLLQLEGANKALLGIGAELAGSDLSRPAPGLVAKLKLVSDSMAGVSSMSVLDRDGVVIAASLDQLMGMNFSQREYFDGPRRGSDRAMLYVSPPFRSTLGNYVSVVSRALTDRDGTFSGVITATLDANYFTSLLRSFLYAPDMRTSLTYRDGRVFLSAPPGRVAGAPAATSEPPLAVHLRSGAVKTLTTFRDAGDGRRRQSLARQRAAGVAGAGGAVRGDVRGAGVRLVLRPGRASPPSSRLGTGDRSDRARASARQCPRGDGGRAGVRRHRREPADSRCGCGVGRVDAVRDHFAVLRQSQHPIHFLSEAP